MAYLSPPSQTPDGGGRDDGDGGDRGQLLLVAVLVLAASFIVLALVINSAIFTENLATRADVAGSEEALEYRAEVIDGVGTVITDANEDPDIETSPELRDYVQDETEQVSSLAGLEQALRGGVTDFGVQDETVGDRIAQDNGTRNLTANDSSPDWTPADNVNRTRNLAFEFTRVETTLSLPDTDSFQVTLDDGSGEWTVSFRDEVDPDVSSDETAIVVERPDGTEAKCVRNGPNATRNLTVDVMAGTANGEPCHALRRLSDGTQMRFGTNIGTPYDISFENGDNADGRYSMVIEGGAPASSGELAPDQNPDYPYATPGIYDVTLSYTYQTHAVTYETDVRVAPGEEGS